MPLVVLFIQVPYYIGDLKRDPILENYPYDIGTWTLRVKPHS